MAFPSERRRLLLALLAELGEKWVSFAELCDLLGADPGSGRGRAIEGMLNRMRRYREVERREITSEEIYDRGVSPSTAYVWRIAQDDARGQRRVQATAGIEALAAAYRETG